MKNFYIVLIFCEFSIRINLCQENQVYTFYPSLMQPIATQEQPKGFAENPPEGEIDYFFETEPEHTESGSNQQTRGLTQYPSESVAPSVHDVVKVTYLSSLQGDTKQIEMNFKSEHFIQNLNNEKQKHSSRPQNIIFVAQTSSSKGDAGHMVRDQTNVKFEEDISQGTSLQQPYFNFPTQRHGNSSGFLSQALNRPAPQQLYYVVKSQNLPINVDQYIQPQPVSSKIFIQDQNRNHESHPVPKTTNSSLMQENLHQLDEQDPRFTHKPYQAPDLQIQTFRTRPQNTNVKLISDFSGPLSPSNQTLDQFQSKNGPIVGSLVNLTYSFQDHRQSPPQTISDGKPSSDIVNQSQSEPGKLEGFTKLTAPHLQPMKPSYITKKPCEICCKPDEVEPCKSCCSATPLLSVKTLKTVLG